MRVIIEKYSAESLRLRLKSISEMSLVSLCKRRRVMVRHSLRSARRYFEVRFVARREAMGHRFLRKLGIRRWCLQRSRKRVLFFATDVEIYGDCLVYCT